jgi:hypothetical protein
MRTNTLLAGALGFILGRATAPEVPAPLGYWDYDPALGTSRGALEGRQAHAKPVVSELSYSAQRCHDWAPFAPSSVHNWARRADGTPWFPRLGRRWPDGHRADYLYYIPAGELIYFRQPGEDPVCREGTGWVLVQDIPGWGWEVSEPLLGDDLLSAVKTVPEPWGLDKATRELWVWGSKHPIAVTGEELAPAGWWESMPEDDPIYLLQTPWVNSLGFTPSAA